MIRDLAMLLVPACALVACAVFAPWWVTTGACVVAGALLLRWVLRVPLGGP